MLTKAQRKERLLRRQGQRDVLKETNRLLNADRREADTRRMRVIAGVIKDHLTIAQFMEIRRVVNMSVEDVLEHLN